MELETQTGQVRDFQGITTSLIHEARVHFDILCERYPDAAIIEMRISEDGDISGTIDKSTWKRTKADSPWHRTQREEQ